MREYTTPASVKLPIALDENIASSGKAYWIKLGEIGNDVPLYDDAGLLDELIRRIREQYGE